MVFSMDAIDLNNPTNLETKKIIAKKMLKKYVVQDHHLIKSTRVKARESIYSVLLLHQYIVSIVIHQHPKNIWKSFSE